MKKLLSVLLAVLMVLGTVTCLFTMPVTAETTEETPTAEQTVETLPMNRLSGYKSPEAQAVTKDTALKVSYRDNNETKYAEYGTAANFVVQWSDKDIGGTDSGSLINKSTPYQFNVTVTTSENMTGTVKVYAGLWSNASQTKVTNFVGVREDVLVPNVVTTAYNCITASAATSAADAATVEAGKTYTYTYVFNNVSSASCNNLVMHVDGIEDGSVTFSDGHLFALTDTLVDEFVFEPQKNVTYLVEENGNVFQRVYGYRAVDDEATDTSGGILATKLGSKFYDILFEGGNTYALKYNLRVATPASYKPISAATMKNMVSHNLYETRKLDYTADYAPFRNAEDTLVYIPGNNKNAAEGVYVSFQDGSNPYAYNWNSASSTNYIRRYKGGSNNFVYLNYYSTDGTLLNSLSSQSTAGIGRDSISDKTNIQNAQGSWMNTVFSVETFGMTLEEAASVSKSNMRYTYNPNAATEAEKWTYNSAYKNIYVPATEDAYVAYCFNHFYKGVVYDMDDMRVVRNEKELDVEFRNYKDEVIETPDTLVPEADVYYDVIEGKYHANIDVPDTVDRDVYSFAWYDGDKLVSTDDTFVFNGDEVNVDNLKPVMTSRNILTNAGGFETYANGKNLEAPFTYINAASYPNYTGPSASKNRFYNQVPSTGDLWTGWDGSMKLSSLKDSDNGETIQKIKDDIAAAGGKITTSGLTGFTWFEGFPTITQATTTKTFKDGGKAWVDEAKHPVAPYSGTKMLRFQASTRTGYRAIEGLTLGKKYTLSFYAYNSYEYVFLKDVAIKTAPYYAATTNANDAKILAYYQTPCVTVKEDTHDKSGTVTGKPIERTKANVDYVGKWYKIELSFTAEQETVYLAAYNHTGDYTDGYTFIDELAVTEFDCKGNHTYDDIADDECNDCGAARVYPTAWDFENGDLTNITLGSGATVVDAVDQPEKIGNKYLQYKPGYFGNAVFAFDYNSEDTYVVSYDLKVFKYGSDDSVNSDNKHIVGANGIDHRVVQGNGYDNTSLQSGTNIVMTRYYENGSAFNTATRFSDNGTCFIGRKSTPTDVTSADSKVLNTYGDFVSGGKMWEEWQHFEVVIKPDGNEYTDPIGYGIRLNGSDWEIGIDNFKVTVIESENIKAADDATNSTNFYNIRTSGVQGLRFKSDINLNFLDNLGNGAKIVEYGTLATKASNLGADDHNLTLLRELAKDKATDSKIVVGVAYSRDSGEDIRYAYDDETKILTYTGVLINISEKNYKTNYAVRGYVIIEDKDGNRFTVYDDVVELSVYVAADYIVKNSKDINDIAAAQSVLDKYAEWEAAQQAA